MKHNFQYHLSREIRAIRMLHGVTPQFFPIVTLNAIVKAVLPYATVFLSAKILTELATLRRANVLWKWVIVTILATALLSVLRSFFMEREETLLNDIYGRKELLFSEKAMSMDFADADRQEVRSLRAQIAQNEQWGGLGLINAAIIYKELIGSLTGIFSGIALTIRLFATPVPESAGKLVLLSSPWFLLPLGGLFVGISLLSSRLYTVYAQEYDRLSKDATFGNRVYTYITKLSRQKSIQMDMRIYRQQKIIDALSAQNQVFTAKGIFGRAALGKPGLCWSVAASSATLTVGCIYVFTCLKAWAGAFDIGLVTQYVGAATALAESLNILISSLGSMKANTTHLDNTFRYLDLPNAMYQGSLTTEKRADRNYQVEFRNVSFKYPGSETWALKNVSMKFQIGKRLAIVGENGSGKTTFIKLLCRLYDPQEGEILLNGIDIRKYRYDDYMGVFSIVFQDFQLISQSLGSNVAGSVDYDPQRVKNALTDAGFGPRLESLPKGLDTQLYKDYGEDGIEVSGGEAQKIAIARALYKDAPFIILDEPTAALDPMAEAEIYDKFNEISGDKTAIYISHRLSSCKFCDEILVFDRGSIIQQGTHEALLEQASGKYAQLWNAQAQYYTA
uniref:ABC transporter ATP-binding protein n=1 Tax=Faecousia sp. TaxID=2952921 RepID=UPI004025AB7E